MADTSTSVADFEKTKSSDFSFLNSSENGDRPEPELYPEPSTFARQIAQRQYFHDGEDWNDMIRRVADHVALAEAIDAYKKREGHYPKWYQTFESRREWVQNPDKIVAWAEDEGVLHHAEQWGQVFYHLIRSRKFTPAGRILQGAASNHGNLLNCYVLEADGRYIDAAEGDADSIHGIYELAYKLARTTKTGGGCGLFLGNLRESGAYVSGSSGESSGPVSFLRLLYATTLRVIKLAGVRRGAGMATLNIDHPDALDFLTAKDLDREKVEGAIESFNISFLVTDEFMHKVESDGFWHFNSVVGDGIVPPSEVAGKYHYPGREPTSVTGNPEDEPTSNEIPLRFMGTSHGAGGGPQEVHDYDQFKDRDGYFAVPARWLWDEISEHAHQTGDPGVVFIDRINEHWPMEEELGPITSTNPCQPSWAPVLTPEGIRTMGEISTGDIVWSGGTWAEVVQKTRTGVKEVYEYHTTAGRFYGTDDHRVVQDGQKVAVGGAEAVDVVAGPVSEDTEIDPRDVMDGLVVGDGTVKKQWTDSLMALVIGEDDECYFSAEIEDLIIRNVDGLDWEVDTSLTPSEMGYTYEREVPDRFYYGSASKKAGFLRGLFSANGCAHEKYNRVSLKAASKQLIFDVQDMLSSLGIRSYYTTNKPSKIEFRNGEYTTRPSYDLNISTDRGKFCDLIGFIHPHKQEILEKISKTPTRGGRKTHDIVDVVPLGGEPVYDITVDADEHTYWTGGLLVSNCGEEPLAPGESCCLGSLVLDQYVEDGEFNDEELEDAVRAATRFLDDVLTINGHPLEDTQEMSDKLRRIGLGVMGDADMCVKMGIPYDSEEAHKQRQKVTKIMRVVSTNESQKLAKEKGEFPLFRSSNIVTPRRNVHTLTVPPTGTTSLISDASSGIEPIYALIMQRRVGDEYHPRLHPSFEEYLRENRPDINLDDESEYVDHRVAAGTGADGTPYYETVQVPKVIKKILENGGSISGLDGFFTRGEQRLFRVAEDVSVPDHVKVQAVYQNEFDAGGMMAGASISKTINMPNQATVEDVEETYMSGWKSNLKGITIYRDGSRQDQVLRTDSDEDEGEETAKPSEIERPETLHGTTSAIDTPLGKLYLTVNEHDGQPYEVFFAIGKAGGSVHANAEAIARVISTALQHGVPMREIHKQLRGISSERAMGFGPNKVHSMPDGAAQLMERWMDGEVNGNGKEDVLNPCPDCGVEMTRQEGCLTCLSCGKSKCG